jgi:hypothetical protein
MTMRTTVLSAPVAVALESMAACSPSRTTINEQSYEISEHVSAVVVDGDVASPHRIQLKTGIGAIRVMNP